MLDAPHLPDRGVTEGPEECQLRVVLDKGWLFGIPLMFAASVLVVFVGTGSAVWALVIAAWGGVIGGPYFGGFVLLNRAELGEDHEADLDHLPAPRPAVAHSPAA